MIRLGSKDAPPWLELRPGIRFQLRAFDPVADMAAQTTVLQVLQAGDEPAAAEVEGFVELARRRVTAWEGILQEDGTAAPCEPDLVEQVLRQVESLLVQWRGAYLAHAARWSAEGNGSAPSPNGTSATAPTTAAAA
jgi:hypothetical protein